MSPETATGPAVVVMASAARPGQVRRALEPLLGPDGCAALQSALLLAAVEWGHAVAPGEVYVAYEPAGAAAEMQALLPAGAVLFPQHGEGIGHRLADATERVFARHRGPVLVVWPDLPRLRPEHAAAALDDLSAGCELALGPLIDGGFYLIAVDEPQPKLFDLPEHAWRAPDILEMALAAARDTGLEVGILRAERALHRPADLRAARADPTLAPELAAILGSRAA
ncbi:MAG TPA: DUF2064 domain-containing protein [Solirubrobacteraceae bacterium]|nr:DUF2064 domain-containing protein [Solirubrobacteraceae bacterium]